MKTKSASFNLRVLISLFVFLAGVFLTLLGFGTFSNASAQANVKAFGLERLGPQSEPSAVLTPGLGNYRTHHFCSARTRLLRLMLRRPTRRALMFPHQPTSRARSKEIQRLVLCV
jgi:hypothetical protein